ncbi:hypothetical protein Ahy_B04g071382 [Arachis hypogaea]|uniref:Protein FAR1-RELATED SEQUENCE n=1 Tax=Arachis hypogaea TaxID=3818 RepID=A0A444ZKN3_ARAHY|nr:hypothetical protein Ahy_B04g071382 [Arachis hypogaea]
MFGSRGILCCHCLAVFFHYGVDRVSSCYVIPCWSNNVQWKHTFIKSSHDEKRSEKRHNLFRQLCSHFYNVAQDFVTCEEEAAMLHSSLDQLRSKLLDYRANWGQVSTKGRPRLKRIGFELDTSIKKSMRRKKKNPPPEVDQAMNPDIVGGYAGRANELQEHGGFLSLLNSFRPT